MTRRALPLLLVLALAGSACQIRFDSALEVKADESGTFAIEIGFDEEFRQVAAQQGGDVSFDDVAGADIPAGWTVSDFTDGGFEGTRIAATFDNLADLQQKLQELEASGSSGEAAPNTLLSGFDLRRDGDVFSFEAALDQVDEEFSELAGGGTLDGLDPAAFLESLFQVRFLVTLPGTIGDHNADSVDGNTLTWRIRLDGQSRTLHAESTAGGGFGFGSLTPILAAVAALGLLAGAGFYVYRRRSSVSPVPALATASRPGMPTNTEPSGPVEGDPFSN